jgi:hypothetical protein
LPDRDYDHLFSLPDVVTLRIWDVYFQGKQAYVNVQERAGKEACAGIVQFYGSLRLIHEGIVHVASNAPVELTKWLDRDLPAEELESMPLEILWYVKVEVADKFEFAFLRILPWAKKKAEISPDKSSPTS